MSFIRDFLNTTIGKGFPSLEEDVRSTRHKLNRIGYDAGDEEFGYSDHKLERAIRNFQRDKDLKEDGIMHPKGETENALKYALFQNNTQVPIPTRKPESVRATSESVDKKLLDFIGNLESSDNYNVIAGGKEKPLTRMTVRDVKQLQNDLKRQGASSTAVGRYQIKGDTLDYLMKRLSLDQNSSFDEELQNRLGKELLKRRGLEDFRNGNMSKEQFIKNLSKEWAALPKDSSNESYYGNIGNNRALTDYKTLRNILEKQQD